MLEMFGSPRGDPEGCIHPAAIDLLSALFFFLPVVLQKETRKMKEAHEQSLKRDTKLMTAQQILDNTSPTKSVSPFSIPFPCKFPWHTSGLEIACSYLCPPPCASETLWWNRLRGREERRGDERRGEERRGEERRGDLA
jgi:hypothetical protein